MSLCVNSLQAFANYLAYKRDNNELLLFILKQLASDHLTFNRNRYGGDLDIVEVPEDEFVEKVRWVGGGGGGGEWGEVGITYVGAYTFLGPGSVTIVMFDV